MVMDGAPTTSAFSRCCLSSPTGSLTRTDPASFCHLVPSFHRTTEHCADAFDHLESLGRRETLLRTSRSDLFDLREELLQEAHEKTNKGETSASDRTSW